MELWSVSANGHGNGHSQFFHIMDTDVVHYACQNTDTDTEMTHITCFCRDTDMYLYFVSVIRGHLRNLRHLHIETPCFRLPKDKFKSTLRLPLSSPTRVLIWRDVRDFRVPMRAGLVHGAMIESCHFISQINLILWNTCSCPCPLWDLRIALRIRTRTSRMLCIALRTRIRTSRFFNVTDDTLQIPCFAYGHGHRFRVGP